MRISRLVPLPLDHVEAELCAFPLASEASLELATIELLPFLKRDTGRLWRGAERELLRAWPATGLDEFVALRDRLWFRGTEQDRDPAPIALGSYLRRLANSFLRRSGTIAVPHVTQDPSGLPVNDLESRARSLWRGLSFALPPDLFLAALDGDVDPPCTVDLLQPVLARSLADRGFAEIHLHLGAALDFPLLWVATLRQIAELDCRPDAFASPGACLDEGRLLGPWLLRAALARYLLAEFLHSSNSSNFRDFVKKNRLDTVLGVSELNVLVTALRELEQGRLREDRRFSARREGHAALRSVYRRLVRPYRRFPDSPEEAWRVDPIAHLVPWSEKGPTPEVGFVTKSLKYMESRSGDHDRFFTRLFWQTVRIRSLYYRHVVQRPLTPGLQWFIRAYGRMKAGRRLVSERLKIENALRLGSPESGLRSLEIRTSPEPTLNKTSALIQAVARAQRQQPQRTTETLLQREVSARRPSPASDQRAELGLVLHFPRVRGGGWALGEPLAFWRGSHADPSYDSQRPGQGNPTGYRYARYYLQQRRTARALSRFLESFPASLTVVRGLDLCTDETAVPTWVLAPLLRYVRDAGEAASRILRSSFGEEVPPLSTTLHAGEDFIHLLTGLRHVDRSIDRFHLRSGDRLGHALALGVDPEKWADRAGRIAMPREDRLFDLLWEWRCYARGGGLTGRTETLRREIEIHSEAIFCKNIPPRTLERFDDLLHDEFSLRFLGFPDGQSHVSPSKLENPSEEHAWCAWRYLTSPDAFRRGREIIRVDPSKEKESLDFLQRELRKKVGTLGLTIETNPSSNLLIGHLGELQDHPLWRLRPPREMDGVAPLCVCIGSDDPLTFATRLPEEYQHLHDALLLAGYSEDEARAWIEAARRAGLDSRFTLRSMPALKIEPWLSRSGPAVAPPP